jgi:hypothetical protein
MNDKTADGLREEELEARVQAIGQRLDTLLGKAPR